ncbi:MAG: DUF3471 domain-containing protein [Mucilaginibacter sp.]
MKKIVTLLFLFATFNSHAQLANTKWKGTLNINGDIATLFDFGKDTLKITAFANGVTIENMVYAIADSTLTLKKTEGQSDCDNDVVGKYKFKINGGALSIKLIADACEDRSSVLNNTTYSKFAWPAAVKVDEAVLKQYPGVYAMDAGHKITVTVENGRLMADSKTNIPVKTEIYAVNESTFIFHFGEITLQFVKDTSGKVSKFVVHQDDRDYDWVKE